MNFLVISTLAFLAAIAIIHWLHNQHHLDIVAHPAQPQPPYPLVSVLIPARNEQNNIRRCVEAILAQDYPNFECFVLDDRSTDATPVILTELSARDSRLVILSGSELPRGWAGKPHALYQAQKSARGEWLLFIDADTFLEPSAIATALAFARQTGADLFTVITRQLMGTFWEKTVLPLVMTALSVGFSPRKVNNPKTRDAIANGQFIFIKRSVYDAVGGHEKLKDRIVEDKAISEQVKWNGYRLVVADGQPIAATRMYTSLPQMWEGWTKNIYLGLADHPALMLLGVFGAFLALTAALFMPIWPLLGLAWWLNGGGWMSQAVIIEALSVWAYLVFIRAQASQAMGISRWYALTLPLGAGVFAAMMFTSAWKVLSGQGVTWRGRRYHP